MSAPSWIAEGFASYLDDPDDPGRFNWARATVEDADRELRRARRLLTRVLKSPHGPYRAMDLLTMAERACELSEACDHALEGAALDTRAESA